MQNNRVLVIIYDDPILHFVLLSQDTKESSILHTKNIRVFSRQIDFSITEYILQALGMWGDEIGIKIVSEMVPLVPQVGNEGVHEIHIITARDDEDFSSITKKVWIIGEDIEKEGTSIIAKQYDFENLLHIHIQQHSTDIVSFKKDHKGTVRIIGESDLHNPVTIIEDNDFKAQTGHYSVLTDYTTIANYLLNEREIPSFHLQDIRSVMLEYILSNYRFRNLVKKEKLSLNSHGRGNIDKNIIIIGGSRVQSVENNPLHIISTIGALHLKGAFSVFIDSFGLCNAILKFPEPEKFLETIRDLLFDFWGYVVIPDSDKSRSMGNRIGEVRFIDRKDAHTENIFDGGVYTFSIEKKEEVLIAFENNYFIKDLQDEFRMSCEDAMICIDTRNRPVHTLLHSQKNRDELLLRWLKGSKALS